MSKKNSPQDAVKVAEMLPPRGVNIGKPGKVITGALRSKMAFPATMGTQTGSGGNFYSPELSTDFLELPQTLDEQRNYFRFFYDNDTFVAQAVDLHTELPLSKVILRKPKAKNEELAQRSLRFFEKWARKVKLLQRLVEITHEYNLIGEVAIFCEDTSPEMPREIWEEPVRIVHPDGTLEEGWKSRIKEDSEAKAVEWLKKNYRGWTNIRVLPPEQIKVETFSFTDEKLVEYLPDSKSKAIIQKAQQGDVNAARIIKSMPPEIYDSIVAGTPLLLNTDPMRGSFVFFLSRKKSQYEEHGKSLLQRCLLPGTPIWVNREGVIQQVSVEEVEDGELLLTHKGRFRPCKTGSRQVDESVVSLSIEGIEEPLRLTADHEVLRVRENGIEEFVAAGDLQPGDQVCAGHITPIDNPPRQIDLASWWKDRTLHSVKRERTHRGKEYLDREVQVVSSTTTPAGLTVTFSYENDNQNRVQAVEGLNRVLRWANTLPVPVVKTQAEVAVEAGVFERDIRVYVPRLRKEGLLRTESKSLGRGRGQAVTWYPSDVSALPQVQVTLTSPISTLQVTPEFCYLLGTWLGDGCAWTEKESFLNVYGVGWSLHDPEMVTRVMQGVETFFPGVPQKRGCLLDNRVSSQDLVLQDSLLARWFVEEFGSVSAGKHLPEWVFHLDRECALSLLRGLLDTDGWLKKGRYPHITITLNNRLLLDQVQLLCSRLGMHTQIRVTTNKAHEWTRSWESKDGPKTKTYYYPEKCFPSLECSRIEDVREWARLCVKGKRVDWEVQEKRSPDLRRGAKQSGGRLLRQVRSVNPFDYKGFVYSFGVEEDETHTTVVLTHNCLRTLVFRDKVRQSLTSIASRHMTPYRLVSAPDMDEEQTDSMREQVDLALQDPDYSIITNFEVTWQELGADQRLPDWSWVFEMTDRQMYAGLGVTESLLSGESSYSGDRIHLEVINTRYMLYREVIQEMVEDYFFAPMAKRMGFVEEDEDGDLIPIIPRLAFTRLALRDNQETFDALLNLYQKGSLDIDVILDLLNIDPVTTNEKLQRDLFTLNDASMNEVLRSAYGSVGNNLIETTDIAEIIAKNLKLHYEKKDEGGGRF